jgi:hypothetical protein
MIKLRADRMISKEVLEEFTDEITDLECELAKYKLAYESAMKIIRSTYAEKFPDAYFISGELGAKDDNNMPEKILVCPAYGLDFAYVYERTEKVSGPEW